MEEFIEKTEEFLEKVGKRKVFLLGVITFTFLLVLPLITGFMDYNSYQYKGNQLKFISLNETTTVMQDADGNLLTMTNVANGANPYDHFVISYRDEIIHYELAETGHEAVYTFSDGSSYLALPVYDFSDNNQVNPNSSITLTDQQSEEMDLYYKLHAFEQKSGTMNLFVIVGILGVALITLGTSVIMYPVEWWRFHVMFTVKSGEPTEFAIFSNRIGGLCCIALAYVGIFLV